MTGGCALDPVQCSESGYVTVAFRRAKLSGLTKHVYTCRLRPKMTQMELQALPCYCATLRQAARAATALYEAILSDSGVPLTQFTALQVMSRSPNLTTTELAEIIGIDQTTATRTLAHIKKAGLARTISAGDRRERRWVLTAGASARCASS